MKYSLKITGWIATLGGAFVTLGYVNPYGGVTSLAEIVYQLSGARGVFYLGFSLSELVGFGIRMIPDFVVEMFLGFQIYQAFCVAGVYVFSRQANRGRWYLQETLRLFLMIMFYQVVFLGMVLAISALRFQITDWDAGWKVLLFQAGIRGLWVFAMILIINLLAIFLGSHIAYSSIMGAQYVLLSAFMFLRPMTEAGVIKVFDKSVMWLNPLAHLVLCWHKEYNGFPSEIKKWMKEMALSHSFLRMVFGSLLVLFIGFIVVERKDLLISQGEEGVN